VLAPSETVARRADWSVRASPDCARRALRRGTRPRFLAVVGESGVDERLIERVAADGADTVWAVGGYVRYIRYIRESGLVSCCSGSVEAIRYTIRYMVDLRRLIICSGVAGPRGRHVLGVVALADRSVPPSRLLRDLIPRGRSGSGNPGRHRAVHGRGWISGARPGSSLRPRSLPAAGSPAAAAGRLPGLCRRRAGWLRG
jgi:hypothetical protein